MDRDRSFGISALIGQIIATQAPCVAYTPREVKRARAAFSDGEIEELRRLGLMPGDFEGFYVIRRFCEEWGVSDRADGEYLAALFAQARHLSAADFENDPYLRAVSFDEVRRGEILLTHATYERGEIFQYDEPDFTAPLVVPRLGFFDRAVRFPTVYEGKTPWMSICPSEINSMREQIAAARGRVLVLGLGLGYYPFAVAARSEVGSITVIERNPDVIALFCEHILPAFPDREKIWVVQADALAYLEGLRGGEYDYCFADIWEGVVDGAAAYRRIRPHEARLSDTCFSYWIEPQIRAYLDDPRR